MGRIISSVFLLAVVYGLFVVMMRFLYPLPSLADRIDSRAIPASTDTALGAALLPLSDTHPGLSGVTTLGSGVDAFAARMALAHGAEASIDAQYYIWQDDLTGLRLLSELQAAAERGVRVRLLVDDNGTPALDQELLALDARDNAEVRLFNPFVLRDPRALGYGFDFFRLNRRMHNKSFTVDGIATIVGGRNIGNVYFETGSGHLYFDLDLLAVGPVAQDVAADFDRYWASASAFPVNLLVTPEPDAEARLAARDAANRDTPQAASYQQAVQDSRLYQSLRDGDLALEWVPVRLFSDDPAKALGQVGRESLLVQKLMAEIGTPRSSFDVISAYFIPGDNGASRFAEFAAAGVRVRTLTNALEATDVVPAHAGYSGYRGALLDGGVEVYELRADGAERRLVDDLGIIGLSKSALHAKSLSVDRARAFIGSFNLDPRSKRLNCEMGLLVDSPALAGGMSDWLDAELPQLAWRVTRQGDGMIWTTRDADGSTRQSRDEPNATLPLRAAVWLIGVLPIEWLL